MERVSKSEFYKVIGPKNCHPHPTGDWPYTSYFKLPNGTVVGKVVDSIHPNRRSTIVSSYFLPKRD